MREAQGQHPSWILEPYDQSISAFFSHNHALLNPMNRFLTLVVSTVLFTICASANDAVAHWKAFPNQPVNKGTESTWIVPHGDASKPPMVSHYRLRFNLDSVPESYVVEVSASSIFHLYLNGVRVASGPALGDPEHWRFETVDLVEHLRLGENVLAAVVWSPGEDWSAPVNFMATSAGFYMKGLTDESINTDSGKWKALANSAYRALPKAKLHAYFALGSFEQFDGNRHPWGWEQPTFDDDEWQSAVASSVRYNLVRSRIPRPEYRSDRLQRVRDATGINVSDDFLSGKAPVTVPPNKTVTILCDRGELVNAYPKLRISGGNGASIEVGYAESLFIEPKKWRKGDRNQIEGKQWHGPFDQIMADGGEHRVYRPLWFRTFRYLRIKISTANQPLAVEDLSCESLAYPFEEVAAFDANDKQLDRIWDVGWRTLKLCAVDMFYDCPYYERLQYVGDTRIEALISVYVSGDSRLMRRAINLYHDSLGKEGLTASRYPSRVRQVIPTFCNWWIAMVDDYRLLNGDKAFIKEMLPGIKTVIERFKTFTNESGLVTFSSDNQWDFVDWSGHLAHGPERKSDKPVPSGLLSLNHVYALDRAVEIMRYVGDEETAVEYETRSKSIKQAVYSQCWDADKGVLADDPRMERYTEHANLLGILTDTIPLEDQQAVMQRILSQTVGLTPATIYFRFYYNRALVKTGLADQYLDTLDIWHDQLKLNLTTWAEMPEPSRSDCHAWGSSPNYEFLATVAGITPSDSGFETIRIAPALGDLESVDARMPHPKGMISVQLQRTGTGLSGTISLPKRVTGTFEWSGKTIQLKAGKQSVSVDATTQQPADGSAPSKVPQELR